jgi:hypothetical protein
MNQSVRGTIRVGQQGNVIARRSFQCGELTMINFEV